MTKEVALNRGLYYIQSYFDVEVKMFFQYLISMKLTEDNLFCQVLYKKKQKREKTKKQKKR